MLLTTLPFYQPWRDRLTLTYNIVRVFTWNGESIHCWTGRTSVRQHTNTCLNHALLVWHSSYEPFTLALPLIKSIQPMTFRARHVSPRPLSELIALVRWRVTLPFRTGSPYSWLSYCFHPRRWIDAQPIDDSSQERKIRRTGNGLSLGRNERLASSSWLGSGRVQPILLHNRVSETISLD